ncbi:MAG TPA: ABC transporter substrate-binding protein [Paenibacillus sp.]|uniref:ABC transporter substrate-binding protein n=1 Tax=Paenibacillus sp. TaxID=58172 RepID=UPI002CC9B794|nr:ABC transporter substrate-binding protein [Paenibacillus sp.]HUC93451.1 ABC transporter substrate-binding protein [Paenibacillus sp.]
MTTKRSLLSLLGICLLILTTACANTKTAPQDKKIRLAYNLWIGSAGVFVADAKDMFEEQGVKVELKQFAGPTEAVQALLSGEVDAALTTLDTAVMLKGAENKADPLKLIDATDLSNGADGIVADPSIDTLTDLKGKTVAATVGAVNHFLLLNALESVGLSESDIKLTNMSPDTIGSAFLAKRVDAAVIWEPFLSEAKAGGGKLLFSSADVPELIIDGMVTTQRMIDEYPEELRKIVDAIESGTNYFHEYPDKGAEIAAKAMDTLVEQVAAMAQGVKLLTRAEAKEILVTNVERTKQTIREFSEFFVGLKLVDASINPDELIDPVLFE